MRIDSLITAEISTNCINAHAGDVDRTVDDAMKVVRAELEKSVQALKDGKFRKGTTIVVGYGVDYSHVSR